MCGIAGIVDLTDAHPVPRDALQRMREALVHRGPDEDGAFVTPRIGLGSRRLAILGLIDGHQPVASEDGSIVAVFNGELFDYPDVKRQLLAGGHRLTTRCDTEVLPHLWEEHGCGMFERLRGQFAVALWDGRRHQLTLARDRFGVIPLYWTRQRRGDEDWFLFASEIKALLASGYVDATADLHGINQIFHFLAAPGPATCFSGVRLLQPGCFLTVDVASASSQRAFDERRYVTLDFPDGGAEDDSGSAVRLVDELDRVLLRSVERRLYADVPVVAYVSGGVDSSLVVAMAAKLRGHPPPTFTVRIPSPGFDETSHAARVARHLDARPTVVSVGEARMLDAYPALIAAAEAPVIDTASAASMLLAEEVHRHGYKVALAGEGSDEWLAGYAWHQTHKLMSVADAAGLARGSSLRRLLARVAGAPPAAIEQIGRLRESLGHYSPFHDLYGLMTVARFLLLNTDTIAALSDQDPYRELQPDLERMRRWHPVNQAAWWAARIHLPGHLLSLKGDRVAMRSSVETRYPFLDEEVFGFLARIHPRWKLHGFRDKYLLRLLAERYLPPEIAWRQKVMFRAPSRSFFTAAAPAYVRELLSAESLRKSGWFDAGAVQRFSEQLRRGTLGFRQRTIVELGMVGVVATQLWHHTFIDGTLADLPGAFSRPRSARRESSIDPNIAASAVPRPGLMV